MKFLLFVLLVLQNLVVSPAKNALYTQRIETTGNADSEATWLEDDTTSSTISNPPSDGTIADSSTEVIGDSTTGDAFDDFTTEVTTAPESSWLQLLDPFQMLQVVKEVFSGEDSLQELRSRVYKEAEKITPRIGFVQLKADNTNFNTTLNLTGPILLGLGIAAATLFYAYFNAFQGSQRFGRSERSVGTGDDLLSQAGQLYTILQQSRYNKDQEIDRMQFPIENSVTWTRNEEIPYLDQYSCQQHVKYCTTGQDVKRTNYCKMMLRKCKLRA